MFILERNHGALLIWNHADVLYVPASARPVVLKVENEVLLSHPRDAVDLYGARAWNALHRDHRPVERTTGDERPHSLVI